MSLYDIHFCRHEELTELQNFIDKYWRKGHVLSYSNTLFEFQHGKEGVDYYTFAIARNIETSEIDAVYGYIESQKYDSTKTVPNIGWGAIWKVRDDVQNKEIGKLGLKLLKYIIKNSTIETFAALGISKTHKDLATALNFVVGETNHYYLVNSAISNFKVAINPVVSEFYKNCSPLRIDISNRIEGVEISENVNPFKNVSYFVNRYQKHPFFRYEFWKVYDVNSLIGVFAVRKIYVSNTPIFRIIDFIGDIPKEKTVYNSIQGILNDTGAEYVDCINAGLEDMFFTRQGFQIAPRNNSTVIPEHLDPLEHVYIPLEYNYMDSDFKMIIFKGDGDQDRPNKV